MSSPPTSAQPEGAEPTFDRRVLEARAAWKDEAQALNRLASAAGSLTKPSVQADLDAFAKEVRKLAPKLAALPHVGERVLRFLELAEAELERRRTYVRDHLAVALREACNAAKLEMRVVRREEPVEVRIPPFAVLIDRKKGRAELQFARQVVATAPAEATAILAAREEALRALSAGFEPQAFFEACLRAWQAARAAGGQTSERVEIGDLLPYLALELQPRAFRSEPTKRNFQDYSRARFAYDLLQLRNAQGLGRNGWRLNLGVATGTTASKKNRALFVEDEHGNGEFKLTVFFMRSEGGA